MVSTWNMGTVVLPPFCVSYEYDPSEMTFMYTMSFATNCESRSALPVKNTFSPSDHHHSILA